MAKKKEMIVPFSNGTEAMDWYDSNCEMCKKAFLPEDGEYPKDTTMKAYVRCGRECPIKYEIDWAFVSSEISLDMAEKAGYKDGRFPATCLLWSERGDDGNNPLPRRPKPVAPNQMVLPFALEEISPSVKPELERA